MVCETLLSLEWCFSKLRVIPTHLQIGQERQGWTHLAHSGSFICPCCRPICLAPASVWEGLCRSQWAIFPCLPSSLIHNPHIPEDELLWMTIPFGSGPSATGVLSQEWPWKLPILSSPGQSCMASEGQDSRVRQAPCLAAAFGAMAKEKRFSIFKGKKKKKEKI